MVFQRCAMRVVRYLPATAMLAAMSYLALRPSPQRAQIPHVPHRLGMWLDRPGLDFAWNVAGYLVLALVIHATVAGMRRGGVRAPAGRVAFLAAVAIGLETAQLFLPHRVFDWKDIAAGLCGVALGTLPWVRWRTRGEPAVALLEAATERA